MSAPQLLAEREAWLAERKTYLGGTDVAAIVGENQFKSPLQVWHDKQGLSEENDNPRMRYGREREPYIAERYAEMTGFTIVECNTFRHPVNDFFAANPDRLIAGKPGVLECKSGINRYRGTYGWGEPGTDQVPRIYLIQGVWYLGILNQDFVDFAFEDRETCETNIYRVFRDMEYEALLFEVAERWWRKHIIGGVEPVADERDLENIKQALPKDNGQVIRATPEQEALAYEAARLKAKAAPFYRQASDIEAQLKQIMGEAAVLELSDDKKVTWKNNTSSLVTDGLAAVKELAQNYGVPDEVLRQIIERHTTTKPGPRVFRLPRLEN